MNIVDLIVAGLIGFYFWRGWSKGLFLSLLGPVSLIVSLIYGYFYFKQTQNFMIALAICIFAPLAINIVGTGLVMVVRKAGGKDDRKKNADIPGRIAGGFINASWISLMIVFSLIMIAMIPVKIAGIEKMTDAVKNSQSFALISFMMGEKYAILKNAEPIDLEKAQSYLPQLQESAEYTQLMEDDRIKAIFENPEVLEKIKNKDIMALMNEPGIQDIMKDPELIRKFLKLNQKMLEANTNANERTYDADDIHENY